MFAVGTSADVAVAQPFGFYIERFNLANPTAEWRTVNFSRSNVPRNKVFIWVFPTDSEYDDAIVDHIKVEQDKYRWGIPPENVTVNDVEYIAIWFEDDVPGPSTITFRYKRLLSTAPLLVIDAPATASKDKGWISRNLTAADFNSSRIILRSVNDSCPVSFRMSRHSKTEFDAYAYPFGFDSLVVYPDGKKVADDEPINIGESVITSHGREMGIQFKFDQDLYEPFTSDPPTEYPINIELEYRAYCPPLQKFASPTPSRWVKLTMSSGNDAALLPRPESEDCSTEVISLTTYGIDPDDDYYMLDRGDQGSELKVTCPGATTELMANMKLVTVRRCDQPILLQAIAAATSIAFRQRCPLTDPPGTSSDPPFVPPLPGHGIQLTATRHKQNFQDGGNRMRNVHLRKAWTIQASSAKPNCRVRVDFSAIDVNRVAVYEDLFEGDGQLMREDVSTVIAIGGEAERYPQTVDVYSRYKGLTYTSCLNRVFVEIPNRRWSDFDDDPVGFRGTYQQVCDRPIATRPPCGTYELTLEAGWEWSTFVFNAINLNQARTTTIVIKSNVSALAGYAEPLEGVLLELDFVSVVQQTWIGHTINFEGYGYGVSQSHSVYIMRNETTRKRAAVGQNELFRLKRKDDAVTLTTDVVLPKGNHIFTVKFRLVSSTNQTTPIRKLPDQILIASKQPKTLEFNIPVQFSSSKRDGLWRSLKFIEVRAYSGREYETIGDSLMINQWAFRHRWVIQARNASCRVAVRFTHMDIGTGYIAPPNVQYVNNQHRLFVLPQAERGIPPRKSFGCDDFPAQNFTDPGRTVCSRKNTNYVSPGGALGIVFQSATYGEYEEYDPSGPYFYPDHWTVEGMSAFRGVETTWGTGWRARYWQICTAEELEAALDLNKPLAIKASSSRWASNLPGTTGQGLILHGTKRFEITPRNASCKVEINAERLEGSSGDMPLMFSDLQDRLLSDWKSDYFIAKEGGFLVRFLGRSSAVKYRFRYRQAC